MQEQEAMLIPITLHGFALCPFSPHRSRCPAWPICRAHYHVPGTHIYSFALGRVPKYCTKAGGLPVLLTIHRLGGPSDSDASCWP